MARVDVTDLEWLAFRRMCLDDGVPVSAALGRLVRHELKRRKVADVRGRASFAATEAGTLFDA